MDKWAIVATNFCKPVAIQKYESAQWVFHVFQPLIEWSKWQRHRQMQRLLQLHEAKVHHHCRMLDYKWEKVTHLLEFDNWLHHQLRLFRALRLTVSALTYRSLSSY